MKKALFICMIFLPLTSSARWGWKFNDYSLLAGQQYRFAEKPLWSIDFQYDRYHKSCTHRSKYFGLAAVYTFNDLFNEVGLKVMWNPTRKIIMVSRKTKFYPYLSGQGNFIQTTYKETDAYSKAVNNYSFRPGLGLTGNIRDNRVLSIRTYFQVGYDMLLQDKKDFENSLVFEFKVGFGINTKRIELEKQRKQNDTQNHDLKL